MQMFVVLTDGASMATSIAIMSAFPGKHFKYSEDVWLVLAEMVAPHMVAARIGLNSKMCVNGVVVSVGTFYGTVNSELRDWLNLHNYCEAEHSDIKVIDAIATETED